MRDRSSPPRAGHMMVGTGYLLLAVVCGLVGGVLSLCLRLPALAGASSAHEAAWHAAALQHGPILVFFSLIPALVGGLGHWFVPLMIGARDTAFPRLGAASLGLLLASALLSLGVVLLDSGPMAPILGLAALHLGGASVLLCAANLVATILNLRAPGLSLRDMPLFVWSQLATCLLLLLAAPILMGAVTVTVLGGDGRLALAPLFQLLGYPGFCVVILPAFGLVSEIVATAAGRALAGRDVIVASLLTLGGAGFLVWAHRMLAAPLDVSGGAYPLLSLAAVLVPELVIAGCWIATLSRSATGRLRAGLLQEAPGLFALGFLVVTLAGVAAMVVRTPVPLHDVLSLAATFALLAGFYYWIGKMSGRQYPQGLARLQFWLAALGAVPVFLPSRLGGLPVQAVGATLVSASVLLFASIAAVTLARRRSLPANPWGEGAVTREWMLPSPPSVPS